MKAGPALTRRSFLRTAVGAGTTLAAMPLLAACGDDAPAEEDATARSLVAFNGGPVFVAGASNRLPFGVADRDGLLPKNRSPRTVSVQVRRKEGDAVGKPIEVPRHDAELPRAYYPFEFEVTEPGFYTAEAVVDGSKAELAFQVLPAKEVRVVQPGDRMPEVVTPTVDAPGRVSPICTRDPQCSLHDVSAATVVAAREPLALLVSTPGFCQVSICGPVLDILLDRVERFPDIRFVHAEVYENPERSLDVPAPVVKELELPFEPVLVLAGRNGRIAARLDTIFDGAELDAALHALTR